MGFLVNVFCGVSGDFSGEVFCEVFYGVNSKD